MAGFEFKGMQIQRLVAHTIHARTKDKQLIPPSCTDALMPLDQDSKDLVQLRLIGALGSSSHGVEMGIAKTDANSFLQRAANMIRCNDDAFLAQSKLLAMALAEAQTNPKWPGGVQIILSGVVGELRKPFLAVIKAETDKGFNLVERGGEIKLEVVKKMLLSATQRLYKVGILVEMSPSTPNDSGLFEVANYRAFLFDHLLTATETGSAAAYFYDAFLGLNILASARKQTEVFYKESKNFINAAPVTEEERIALWEALRVELRNNAPTINATEFAENNLPEPLQKEYLEQLISSGFPNQAVVKDLDYIKHKLRRPRHVLFTSGVSIRVPAGQVFSDTIKIVPGSDGYTQVMIRGTVQDRE
jgi:hypothetical protein